MAERLRKLQWRIKTYGKTKVQGYGSAVARTKQRLASHQRRWDDDKSFRLRKGLLGMVRNSRHAMIVEPWILEGATDIGDDRYILKAKRTLQLTTLGEPSTMKPAQRRDLGMLGKTAFGKGGPIVRHWATALLTGERPTKRIAPDIDDVLTRHGCYAACIEPP
jgi:hypothetical protein